MNYKMSSEEYRIMTILQGMTYRAYNVNRLFKNNDVNIYEELRDYKRDILRLPSIPKELRNYQKMIDNVQFKKLYDKTEKADKACTNNYYKKLAKYKKIKEENLAKNLKLAAKHEKKKRGSGLRKMRKRTKFIVVR
jgi:hypothetical protein